MNPIPLWAKILIPLLLAAAAVLYIHAYGHQQFVLGEKAERAAWLARENAQLTKANAKIKALEEKYRQQEQDAADAIAVISTNYQKDLSNVKAEKDRVIAGLRGGTFRLRIPVAARFGAGRGTAAEVAAPACGRDGEARTELPIEASEFLVGLTSEADEVVKQLGACQAVINADRTKGKE